MAANVAVNGKQKQKPAVPIAGVYKPEAIKVRIVTISRVLLLILLQDVAESLGLTNLSDVIASALASDVEYRIQQVIEVPCFHCYKLRS
jgi:hypothetical protein